MMKNQAVNPKTGVMEQVRLYFKCGNCKKGRAFHCFPAIYTDHNFINERQQIYTLWRAIFDTEQTVMSNADISHDTMASQKKSLFALLDMLYVKGTQD